MGLPLSSFSADQRRMAGMEIPTKAARAKRGTGKAAMRKAAMIQRHQSALELLQICSGVLPDGVSAKPMPSPMNKWETKFASELGVLQTVGEVRSWAFEFLRFDLGGGVTYTPDFIISYQEVRPIRIVEIKSKLRRRVEFWKMARAKYPQFEWSLLELVEGSWRPMKVYGGVPNPGSD